MSDKVVRIRKRQGFAATGDGAEQSRKNAGHRRTRDVKQPRPEGAPWTAAELAAAFRVPRKIVAAWVLKGEIEAIRIGTSFRIPDRVARRLLDGTDKAPAP